MSQGAGIRAQSGERTGYAHTDDLALPNLEEAARQARAIADQTSASTAVFFKNTATHEIYTLAEPPSPPRWPEGRAPPRNGRGGPR